MRLMTPTGRAERGRTLAYPERAVTFASARAAGGSRVAMERLEVSLIVGFGAVLGSVLRRSILLQSAKPNQTSNPLPRLLVTAAGSFLAGQVTGYFMLVSQEDYSWGIAFLRNIGFLLAGIGGGYVTFPVFTREPVVGGDAPGPGLAAFRLFSAIIVAISFFCAGALFVR